MSNASGHDTASGGTSTPAEILSHDLAKLMTEVAALRELVKARDAECFDAHVESADARAKHEEVLKFLGRMGEELVNSGGKPGDRHVQLDNLRALIAERDALRVKVEASVQRLADSMKREAASLREYEAMVKERDAARTLLCTRDAAGAELARLSAACSLVVKCVTDDRLGHQDGCQSALKHADDGRWLPCDCVLSVMPGLAP